jgi:hypothetical protein
LASIPDKKELLLHPEDHNRNKSMGDAFDQILRKVCEHLTIDKGIRKHANPMHLL